MYYSKSVFFVNTMKSLSPMPSGFCYAKVRPYGICNFAIKVTNILVRGFEVVVAENAAINAIISAEN